MPIKYKPIFIWYYGIYDLIICHISQHIFLTHLKRQNPQNIGSGPFWILNE